MYLVIGFKNDELFNGIRIGTVREVSVPIQYDGFNVNNNQSYKSNIFRVANEQQAMSVAEQLAKDRPECHWFVCTTTTAYKADTPTVSKYEISERGVLPA